MDTARDGGTSRGVAIGEAAQILGLTTTAVRKRIRRGSLPATKNADGTWTVHLAPVPPGQDAGRPAGSPADGPAVDGRVAILERENERLWQELERRSEELRRKDVILAQFAERLPELPAACPPPEASASPRPWWKFWISR